MCLLSQVIVNIITDILSLVIPHVMSTLIQDGHGVKLTNLLFCPNTLSAKHSQYFLAMCLLYTFSLPQYFGHYNITCGVINRVLTWDDIHSVIPPSHSSHRRPALTLPMDTHHTRPSPGGKLFVCVHLFHYRDKRVLPESGQEKASISLFL